METWCSVWACMSDTTGFKSQLWHSVAVLWWQPNSMALIPIPSPNKGWWWWYPYHIVVYARLKCSSAEPLGMAVIEFPVCSQCCSSQQVLRHGLFTLYCIQEASWIKQGFPLCNCYLPIISNCQSGSFLLVGVKDSLIPRRNIELRNVFFRSGNWKGDQTNKT